MFGKDLYNMKKTLEKMVWSVLKHYPETRNSDILLTQMIWKLFYPQYLIQKEGRFYIDIHYLFKVEREDHITRIRRHIQNIRREWLPTDFKVFVERVRLSKEWKEYLGYRVDWSETDWKREFEKVIESEKNKQLKFI